jgi:hypothetical protein
MISRYNTKQYPDDQIEMGERQSNPDPTTTSKSHNKKRQGRRKEKLFGKSMSVVSEGTFETPDPILSLIMYLQTNALDEEELFRKSASTAEITSLKNRLDNDLEVRWSEYDIPTLAGLLKAYVRELPDPLIPPTTYIHLSDLNSLDSRPSLLEHIRTFFLSAVPPQSMSLLAEIIGLLKATIEHSARNGMSMKSVVTVWTPNLIRHEDVEEEVRRIPASQKLVRCLIEFYDDLF